ncbi:MAG: hypothetical protein IKO36_00545 [Bacteroidaceae bacterium]|nr:hypothetical protein [Bacteroidaceae bacterium]
MIDKIINNLTYIPVPILIGLCYAVAFLMLPFSQFIDYKCDCKKYGKDTANEIWRRM